MSETKRYSTLDLFGVGWTAVFDREGNGPGSARWHVYRHVINGEVVSVGFGTDDSGLFTWSGGNAREVAEAILAALDVAKTPPYDFREVSEADRGPDEFEINSRDDEHADQPQTRTVKGWKLSEHLAVHRDRTGPAWIDGAPLWSLSHLPTGLSFGHFDTFVKASAAADLIRQGHERGDFDISLTDAAAIVAQKALGALYLSLPSEQNAMRLGGPPKSAEGSVPA